MRVMIAIAKAAIDYPPPVFDGGRRPQVVITPARVILPSIYPFPEGIDGFW